MNYTNEKIKVTKIEDKYCSDNKICSCCGNTKKKQGMWVVSYQSPNIDPLYFCHKCAPTKDQVTKILGCEDYISSFTTADLLYSFVAILKIKGVQVFSPYHLIEYIKKCKIENEFDYILEDWNSILGKFDSTITEMIHDGLLNRAFQNINTMATISSTFPISGILRKSAILDNLDEILSFTNNFLDNEKNIFNNRNPLFNNNNNNNHIRKREK